MLLFVIKNVFIYIFCSFFLLMFYGSINDLVSEKIGGFLSYKILS